MFYYLLAIVTVLSLVVAIIVFIDYWRGARFNKSREQREIEENMQKTFGKDTKWGFYGGAENETRNHSSHSDHSSHGHYSDSSGGHDGGGGDGGGGGH